MAPARTACTATTVTTSSTATRATTSSYAGAGNDEVTGDEGDDVIYPGPGADTIYGEEGDNTIIATNDGVRDDIFCNMIKVATPPGTIIYIGEVDPLDALRNCKVVVQ